MKKHYQKYCRHLSYAIIFTSSFATKALAQETLSFTINPEASKQIVEKYNLEAFKVYPVILKEIEYYPYVDGEVLTDEYKRQQNQLDRYKPAFNEYNNTLKANSDKTDAIKTISKSIDAFLDSNEKYEVKEKLLIESQSLASKYDIVVQVPDDRIKLQSFLNTPNTNHNTGNDLKRIVLLYQSNKKTNKNDLKIFKEEIQKIKIPEPEITNDYRMYLETLKELSTIQKTETGRVLSDKVSKKSAYVIQETPVDISVLSGEFTELPDSYMLTDKEIPNRFIKNQLFTEKHEGYKGSILYIDRFSIFKKSNTNELFYIMSNRFVAQLKNEAENEKYRNLGNNVEYKTWVSKYISLQQSAQINVNFCNAIIKKHTYLNRLGQKRYDTSTFTKQEKTSFNLNLDSLNEKLRQIGDLEGQRDFLSYYNDKVSDAEATKSYNLSTYYNNTSKAY